MYLGLERVRRDCTISLREVGRRNHRLHQDRHRSTNFSGGLSPPGERAYKVQAKGGDASEGPLTSISYDKKKQKGEEERYVH